MINIINNPKVASHIFELSEVVFVPSVLSPTTIGGKIKKLSNVLRNTKINE